MVQLLQYVRRGARETAVNKVFTTRLPLDLAKDTFVRVKCFFS